MIAEKTNIAQQIINAISPTAGKVNFINDITLTNALLYLENKGIPSNKHEDYKYCNMDAVFKRDFKNIEQKFETVTNADLKPYKLDEAVTLVVVNGNYSEELSDKIILKGVHINSFSNLDEKGKKLIASIADVESDAFIAMNTAFSGNGFHLCIEKNETLQMPIHILHVSSSQTEALVNTRNIIELQENSEAVIIEEQVILGEGKIFTNFLSEKFVSPNAKLTSYIFQNEKGFSVNTNQVKVERNGVYDNTTVTLGGQVVRNNHNVVLAGENSTAHLNGFFSAKNNQLIDNHTLMDHQVPNCESNELYKGFVNDKSIGVFNGKIYVRKDAQKTNAYQSSKNILLSDDATINTKPQLEIYANDVKCSHGTSTGKIDENALFYLNARGIGKESAKKILLASFAQEVINKMEVEGLKQRILETAKMI